MKLFDLDEKFTEWVESRPEVVKQMILKRPPNLLYLLKTSGHRVVPYSYAENGTMTVSVLGKYNKVDFERNVFGIDPDDLEECDGPAPGEEVGTILKTREEVDAHIREVRMARKAPLN